MLRKKGVRRALLVLGLALAAIPATASTALAGTAVGAVYVQTNTAPANFVRVFYRASDGTLTPGPTVATGGSGSATAPPLGLAITDSAGSVTLTENNNVLLVTNSGSNTISSFRVLPDGNIVLADQESSGGVFPVSVAASNGDGGSLVYALNAGTTTPPPIFAGASGSVSGFTLDSNGNLTAITGSTRAITGGTNSAQVGFNNDGSVLTVTNRNSLFAATGAPNGTISTWIVGKGGLLGSEVVSHAIGSGAPFGFGYTNKDYLLVANNGTFEPSPGTASSYGLDKKTAAVTGIDNEVSGGVTCWVAITNNGKFGYFSSIGPPGPISEEGSLAGFRVENDGQLTPAGFYRTHGGGLDDDTSRDGQYLYLLTTELDFLAGIGAFIGGLPNVTPGVFPFGPSMVTAYKIDQNTGALTELGVVPAGAGGNSGLAAY